MTVVAFRVTGADDRLVGTYSPAELATFKDRIGHSVRHGTSTPSNAPAHGDRSPERLAPEAFVIVPLDAAGNVCGDVETWAAEEGETP